MLGEEEDLTTISKHGKRECKLMNRTNKGKKITDELDNVLKREIDKYARNTK